MEKKEAMKILKDFHDKSALFSVRTALDTIIPELKDSEDEQSKKWILEYLYDGLRKSDEQFKGQFKAAIAWLERHDEKLPAGFYYVNSEGEKFYSDTFKYGDVILHAEKQDKKKPVDVEEVNFFDDFRKTDSEDEPKFHEGDWITNGDYTWKIVEVKPLDYILKSQDGNIVDDTISYVDEEFHLWTIQDAKDGDVLHSTGFHSDCIFIFNGLDNWKFDEPDGERAIATGHCCLTLSADNIEFDIQGPDCIEINTVKPATKIQRDLLEKAMTNAGYRWNLDENKIEKIEQKLIIEMKSPEESLGISSEEYNKIVDECIYGNNKATWSEEDDYNLQCIIAKVTSDIQKGNVGRNQELIDWLKSLKDKYTWKPTEEQMKALHDLNLAGGISYAGQGQVLIELYNDLKKF